MDNTFKLSKAFSRLMTNISSKSSENYYCYRCFHTFRSQSKLEEHHKLCKDKNHCKLKLPTEGKAILSHKFGSKALKMNDVMYLDLECILEKYGTCEYINNENIPSINKKRHAYCVWLFTNSFK